MQGNAMAHKAKNSIDALHVFSDRDISPRRWPMCSPNLNPCGFYLWGTLKEQSKLFGRKYWA
jgi:hypothetical protein